MTPCSQMRRLARGTSRSLAPNGRTSANPSHSLQLEAVYRGVVYSGRFSANRLTSTPSASYAAGKRREHDGATPRGREGDGERVQRQRRQAQVEKRGECRTGEPGE